MFVNIQTFFLDAFADAQTIESVNGYGTNGVVNLEDLINEFNTKYKQDIGSYSHQSGQCVVKGQIHIRLYYSPDISLSK